MIFETTAFLMNAYEILLLSSISGVAGFYTCTGTNHLGSVATSAELVVNSGNWGIRK